MAKENAAKSLPMNGQPGKDRTTFQKINLTVEEPETLEPDTVEELSAMVEQIQSRLGKMKKAKADDLPSRRPLTTSAGRRWSVVVIVVMSVALGMLYNYIVENELSLKPIDLAAVQKVILTVIVFFIGLGCVERSLRYFLPVVHHYFVNDNESEQDFSKHFDTLDIWQKHLLTAFYVGLLFWAFVQLLQAKY